MKLIIDIDEDVYKDIIICESGESAYYFEGLIQNGTPIPDNATNFDVYFTLFDIANEKLGVFNRFIEDDGEYPKYNRLSKTWGNAPYKGEAK